MAKCVSVKQTDFSSYPKNTLPIHCIQRLYCTHWLIRENGWFDRYIPGAWGVSLKWEGYLTDKMFKNS